LLAPGSAATLESMSTLHHEPSKTHLPFPDVPDAGSDLPIDPHWLDLRSGAVLPAVYMPPAMAGPRPRAAWLRATALVVVSVFLLATAAGVCLTYGPSHLW
jgi:hypothetical protein